MTDYTIEVNVRSHGRRVAGLTAEFARLDDMFAALERIGAALGESDEPRAQPQPTVGAEPIERELPGLPSAVRLVGPRGGKVLAVDPGFAAVRRRKGQER
jgi:hypothetical protein